MSLLSILLLVVGLIYSAHSQSNINIIICVYKQYGLGCGAVRLVRNGTFSSSYSAGIVQIYYFTSTSSANYRWGNICDDSSLVALKLMSFVTSWGTMEHLIMVVLVAHQSKPVVMNNYHAIHAHAMFPEEV